VTNETKTDSAVAAILGEANVAAETDAHAVDGVTPGIVATPANYDEVGRVLAHADANGLAVIPLGGRIHAGLGNLPARYDIGLDATRLGGVVEFEPADLTITVQAGMPLARLREVTAESGLMVPFDPAIPGEATVGGVLAADVWGAASCSLGTPRDFTIGMRVVTASGRLTRAGGKVVKNVAGYDLCKLYIGSVGTLGVIVEATFKTKPLPKAEAAVALAFESAVEACAAANRFHTTGLSVRSSRVVREDGVWVLDQRLAGMPSAVERSIREIRSAGAHHDAPLRAGVASAVVLRINAVPSKVAGLMEAAASATSSARIEAHPVTGACLVFAEGAGAIEMARGMSPTCVVQRCPAELKRGIDVFGGVPASFALMQAIKQQFDPKGTLSPGRFVGHL